MIGGVNPAAPAAASAIVIGQIVRLPNGRVTVQGVVPQKKMAVILCRLAAELVDGIEEARIHRVGATVPPPVSDAG